MVTWKEIRGGNGAWIGKHFQVPSMVIKKLAVWVLIILIYRFFLNVLVPFLFIMIYMLVLISCFKKSTIQLDAGD